MLFGPIRRWETVRDEHGAAMILMELSSDAFRMCWLLYTFFFFAIAIFVTVQFAATDFNDNPILNRFGGNSICVMLDDPPFSLFGSTLWFPSTMLLLAFEVLHFIQVYDHYHDEDAQCPITKGFFTYYRISTVVECLSVIVFAQVFATSPTEYIYMHTWPYFAFTLPCLLLVALKRFLYFRKVTAVPLYVFVWIVICVIDEIIFLLIFIPNLYGAKLWETYPWTGPLGEIIARLKFVLLWIVPPIIYVFFDVELDTVVVTLKRSQSTEEDDANSPSARGLMRRLFQPISGWKTGSDPVQKGLATTFEIHPDAFRMCFHFYIVAFFAVACFVTLIWGDIDWNDNVMVNRFGYSAFSIMFSDPPFSLFASTLWFPATILLLSFEVFDYVRVYDHYLNDAVQYPLSKCFIVYYSASTLIECLSVICLPQVFASSPAEHIHMHTWPYIIFVLSFWLMVLKRFLYLRKVRVVSNYGVIHVMLCLATTIIAVAFHLPNLFGAKLWESYPWTMTVQKINDVLYALLMVVAPVVIYALIGKRMDAVVVTVKRSCNVMEKSDEEQGKVSHGKGCGNDV